jgi:release factor glutamine methyltransferase
MAPITLLADLTGRLTAIYTEREAHNIAQIVLEDRFGITDVSMKWMDLANQQQVVLSGIVEQLLQGIPWQYVLGQADFYGYKFGVNRATLIPRIETEELVHWIIQEHQETAVKILDIGTGSGCIAITLQKEMPMAQLTAIDVSEGALEQTIKNAQQNRVLLQTKVINILDRNEWQQLPVFDVIVSNPPYIPPSEKKLMPAHVLDYEPGLALFVEETNPLVFYKVIIEFGEAHLARDGYLYFEINEHFGPEVVDLFEQKECYHHVTLKEDFQGRARMIRAQKK